MLRERTGTALSECFATLTARHWAVFVTAPAGQLSCSGLCGLPSVTLSAVLRASVWFVNSLRPSQPCPLPVRGSSTVCVFRQQPVCVSSTNRPRAASVIISLCVRQPPGRTLRVSSIAVAATSVSRGPCRTGCPARSPPQRPSDGDGFRSARAAFPPFPSLSLASLRQYLPISVHGRHVCAAHAPDCTKTCCRCPQLSIYSVYP